MENGAEDVNGLDERGMAAAAEFVLATAVEGVVTGGGELAALFAEEAIEGAVADPFGGDGGIFGAVGEGHEGEFGRLSLEQGEEFGPGGVEEGEVKGGEVGGEGDARVFVEVDGEAGLLEGVRKTGGVAGARGEDEDAKGKRHWLCHFSGLPPAG